MYSKQAKPSQVSQAGCTNFQEEIKIVTKIILENRTQLKSGLSAIVLRSTQCSVAAILPQRLYLHTYVRVVSSANSSSPFYSVSSETTKPTQIASTTRRSVNDNCHPIVYAHMTDMYT